MAKHARTAITPTRNEDFSEWYQQVIKGADLAEHSPVRGCMIIRPWGYGIWEKIRDVLDAMIKDEGHENVYFPQFIPLSYLEKEAAHIEGFAKECAVVTHHRLEEKNGSLIPAGKLEEPLVIRPTSETVVGKAFSKWVQSYRDLPMGINQWANVVRWEMRTRLFLRTSEFLWQEGHTAHAKKEEAEVEALKMLEVYNKLLKNHMAIPTVHGKKTESERFPGATETYCLEAMMQDRKAVQATTSHDLGQNFSKAFDIEFSDKEGNLSRPYTTSWGASTRLIGALIMTHGDDDGLRVPPKIAPKQVAIIPFLMKEEFVEKVLKYTKQVESRLKAIYYSDCKMGVTVDKRDMRSGEKNWDWIRKGIPIRLEIGAKEAEEGKVTLARRDKGHKDKMTLSVDELVEKLPGILDDIQANYLSQAKKYIKENTYFNVTDFAAFQSFFKPKNADKPEIHGGFVHAKWCERSTCEDRAAEEKVTIRCLPFKQSGKTGKCVICGEDAITDAVFSKAY